MSRYRTPLVYSYRTCISVEKMKGSLILFSLVILVLHVQSVGASKGFQYETYILLNPCGNDGNFTNTIYQLHAPGGITRVRLQEVHEKEIYIIIQQLLALEKNNTDLVIMSSELMKAFPAQLQQSFGEMEIISMSTLANPPYSPSITSGQSVDGEDECSPCRENGSAHFEIAMPIKDITLDNVALIALETHDKVIQKTCHSIESVLLADECTEHGITTGTEFLKYTIARLFYDNGNVCRKFVIHTLMWRDDGRELSSVGTVNLNGDIVLHSSIFPNVDFGFNQRKFVVSTQPVFPFEFKTNTSFDGLCIDLLAQLAIELNFTFEVIVSPDGDFGVMLDNDSWTGLIGQLQRKDVDLVAAPLSITIQRERVMDFIHPFFHDHSVVLIQKPDPQETKWRTLIDPYSDTVIISIGLSLPLASLVLVALENISPFYSGDEREPKGSDLNSFLGSFWYLFGALLTQGGKYTPHALSSRLFVGMWWLFCIISLATYSGNLIASLTVSKEKLPFKSLKEMVSQDKFIWGTFGGTVFVTMFQESVIPEYNAIWRGMVRFNATDPSVLNKNPDQHMQKVLGGNYAYIAAKSEVDTQMTRQCGLATIDEQFLHMQYAFGVPNNSPYTDILSLKIMKILESGLMNVWERKWWSRQKLCYEATWDQRKVINLMDVQSAFYLIGIGIVLASLVVAVEWICFRIIRKNRKEQPAESFTADISALPV